MSYVDRKPGSNQKALTAGLVALIQGGIAIALINGFAVRIFETEPPPRLAGEQIKLEPLPPEPAPDPVVEPSQTPRTDPIAIPQPSRTALEPNRPVQVTLPTIPTGDTILGGEPVLPPIQPTTKPPRFAPKAARVSNNAAGWVTTQDYPTRDIRAGNQGTVRFELAIDARGRVSQCTILASSGYPGLDEATCKHVAKRARFEPATNGEGERVADTYTGTIRWVIPRD